MPSNAKIYDLIVYGDEVPGVLGLVSGAREYYRRVGKYPRTLLMVKGNARDGIGGTLVRGGLAYLDRSGVRPDLLQALGLEQFGDPCAIYKEFLQRAQVEWIALDPAKGDGALRWMLGQVGAQILSNVKLESVIKEGTKIAGIQLARGEIYWGGQFIDSTVNAELAQVAGVRKLQGYETFGLPDSELPVTLCFETEGVTIETLKQVELDSLNRFTNPFDLEAQNWIDIAAGFVSDLANVLKGDLLDSRGQLKTLYHAKDFIDVRCRSLSIAYHSFRDKKFSLSESGSVLDNGNVAVLQDGRLSWNSLLFDVSASEADGLARGGSKPTPAMLEEMDWVSRWFKKALGATAVKPNLELYVRHGGNVTGVVEPLTGTKMLEGGVPENEALATFSYHFDVRGGIKGLGEKGKAKGFNSVSFHTKPIFNVGIRHAQIQTVPNLAVVSPASGFEGYASPAGRIVEFNVAVAQGLGIAAAIALEENRNLAEISNAEVRAVLVETGQLPQIYGETNEEAAEKMRQFEAALVVPSDISSLPLPTTGAPGLRDIEGHWAIDFIQPLFDRQYIQGLGDGTFKPDASMTRAEYAAILAKSFDLPLKSAVKTFSDVPADFWGSYSISKATRMGFMSGFPDGSFRPGKPLTRAEAMVSLVSGLELKGGDGEILSSYLDRPQIPSYAIASIATATEQGLVVNYPNRRQLRPRTNITRAEVAAVIYQALVLSAQMPPIACPYIVTGDRLGEPHFSDLEGHWAEQFILDLARNGLVDGFQDGSFRPDAPMSRAQYATLIDNAFDPPPRRSAAEFQDVPRGFWAYHAIQKAYRANFLSGFSERVFAPNLNLQRLQLWLSLVSGQGWSGGEQTQLEQFSDRDEIPSWAKPAVATATEKGLVFDRPNGDGLEPHRDATRAEVVAAVYQALLVAGENKIKN